MSERLAAFEEPAATVEVELQTLIERGARKGVCITPVVIAAAFLRTSLAKAQYQSGNSKFGQIELRQKL